MLNLSKQVATSPFLDSITNIPNGYCQCGCGRKTTIIIRNDAHHHEVAGMYRPFIRGHYNRRPIRERFWEKVKKSSDRDGCWIYTARKNSKGGYGMFSVGQMELYAHRVSWELTYGAIPDGLLVLHDCDNPPCVRPSHLFLGDNDDNMRDMMRKGRQCRGVDAYTAKLNPRKVKQIRKLFPKMMRKDIAKMFGISPRQVLSIGRREHWRHIP